MDKNKEKNNEQETEFLNEKEARILKELFRKYLKNYKEKPDSMTDKEWLNNLFKSEIPGMKEDECLQDANEIIESIEVHNENLKSINEESQQGVSKEKWLADKIQEVSVGMAVNEYGQTLQAMDDILYHKNMELADALQRSSDGHIKMSPNLDGNIAENMIANSTELSGFIQRKNIKVEVRDVFTENSVDVRAINLDSGRYQNYQLKFGKDAKATIDLIERGNYSNQQIIVPTEQLEDVQAHFKRKGSEKTISDHINAWGAEGKKFTKEEMKEFQLSAQEDGIMPTMDYNHYQTKDLAMSIGKNASALAVQSAAVSVGLNVAKKVFDGEQIDADELVEVALKTGADTSLKVVSAGTLQVAVRKGFIHFIPKATPAGVLANIASVGIENLKIIGKIASGELSVTKGIDQMGNVTTSMIGGLWSMSKGAAIGVKMTAWIPIIGMPLSIASGFIGGTIGYLGGSKFGNLVYQTGKKVVSAAKNIAKAVFTPLKNGAQAVRNYASEKFHKFTSFLGF